jgi:RNA-directed DNA polymerase
VKQNKGKPGIDEMTVNGFSDYLRRQWLTIREQLLVGNYQPSLLERRVIPKRGGGE